MLLKAVHLFATVLLVTCEFYVTLSKSLFLLNKDMVNMEPVNRLAGGSNPSRGATFSYLQNTVLVSCFERVRIS